MATVTSTKRALIDKANSTIVIMVSVAAALTVFSLVATKTLYSQAQYQNCVIDAKQEALDTLEEDIANVSKLKVSYDAFVSTSQNAIGGNTDGISQRDGDNAKIVLDALPSFYDFPSLTTNLETLINSLAESGQSVKINSIAGVDDEVAQAENAESSNPEPVQIPFTLSVEGSYDAIEATINTFERSIRPIKIIKYSLLGNDPASLTLSIDAETYYQPAKSLKIQTKVVE